jgi:hypothetical protein
VTTLQLLSARQRAVLILREVPGYRANEVARMLDTTVGSVNSFLKRARAALKRRLPCKGEREALPAPNSSPLVANFVRAYQSGDVDALVALLTADADVGLPRSLPRREPAVRVRSTSGMRTHTWAADVWLCQLSHSDFEAVSRTRH